MDGVRIFRWVGGMRFGVWLTPRDVHIIYHDDLLWIQTEAWCECVPFSMTAQWRRIPLSY